MPHAACRMPSPSHGFNQRRALEVGPCETCEAQPERNRASRPSTWSRTAQRCTSQRRPRGGRVAGFELWGEGVVVSAPSVCFLVTWCWSCGEKSSTCGRLLLIGWQDICGPVELLS